MVYNETCAYCGSNAEIETSIFVQMDDSSFCPQVVEQGKTWDCPVCGHINNPKRTSWTTQIYNLFTILQIFFITFYNLVHLWPLKNTKKGSSNSRKM